MGGNAQNLCQIKRLPIVLLLGLLQKKKVLSFLNSKGKYGV
jgi:hypothetical protein